MCFSGNQHYAASLHLQDQDGFARRGLLLYGIQLILVPTGLENSYTTLGILTSVVQV